MRIDKDSFSGREADRIEVFEARVGIDHFIHQCWSILLILQGLSRCIMGNQNQSALNHLLTLPHTPQRAPKDMLFCTTAAAHRDTSVDEVAIVSKGARHTMTEAVFEQLRPRKQTTQPRGRTQLQRS